MVVPKALIRFTFILVFAQLLIISCSAVPIQAGETAAVTESAPITVASDGPGIMPPESPVKVVFIHHSTGENWLADDDGGLGIALRDNNYFVSDTNYGWGTEAIGSSTDIGHWWTWFRSTQSPGYLAALFNESGDHSSGRYSRLAADPGGQNRIVIFKSCFPNSALQGSPSDPVPPIGDNPLKGNDCGSEHHTVANAKGIYIDILEYFGTKPDTLFVVIAAPPLSDGTYAANARAFNQWLATEWLSGYPGKNVFVFDFYNVLTTNGGNPEVSDLNATAGNHHRWWNGAVQHQVDLAFNTSAYPSPEGDDHPAQAGNQKATAEFVPLLNYAYNRWANVTGDPTDLRADFTANVTAGPAPLAVQFTDLSTGNPKAWNWSFGDGATSELQHAAHEYTADGNYTVSLTVSNAFGSDTSTVADYIRVSSAPTVTGIEKDYGTAGSGGSTVRIIRGTGFTGTPEVALVNGSTTIAAANVTVVSPTKLTCTLDLATAPAQKYDVRVTTAGSTGLLRGGFTVFAVPPAMFRADHYRTGAYPDTGADIPSSTKWTFVTGRDALSSSPCVSEGVVYVGSYDWNLYAIDAATGVKKWNITTGSEVLSSPCVSSGIVYVGSYDGIFYALDTATGTEKWSSMAVGQNEHSSPGISDGIVCVGGMDGRVHALDAATGRELWTYTTGGSIQSSPGISDGIVYIGSDDRNLYAIDAVTGREIWIYTTGGEVGSSPCLSDGVVYVGSYDRNLYAIDAATGVKKWNVTTGGGVGSSPCASNGVVYAGSDDGVIYALDTATGELQWTFPTGSYVLSSPCISDGVVYVGSYDNNLYAIDAGTGTQKWAYLTGAEVRSSPCVNDGVVYVGSGDGRVHAIGAGIAPTAIFTANVTIGPAPLAVQFTDISTGNPTAWNWTFGDGATSTAQHPPHTYTVAGNYSVSLTVSNGNANDTLTRERYVLVQPPLPNARLIFNVNYNRGTSNNSIANGTSPCRLVYYTDVSNSADSQESISGNLSFALNAPSIIYLIPDTCAELNGTQATWTFPPSTAIGPGTTLATTAGTSVLTPRTSGVTLERICNKTIFTNAGVQQVTLRMTFATADLDDLWGRLECAETADVRPAFVPGTVSTDLPLRGLSEGSGHVTFEINRSRVEAGRQYTLSCAVAVDPLRSVAYAPTCAVWEVTSIAFTDVPAGAAVALPASLCPQNVSSVAFSSDTPCRWSCSRNVHTVTSLNQRAIPAPAANFTANVTSGAAPLTVQFTDISTGNPTAWNWSFGDGTTSTEQHPAHTYTLPGNHTVTLTVDGGLSTATKPGYIRTTPVLFGDANEDGKVNQADTLTVLREVVGLEEQPDAGTDRFKKTDVHANNVIEVGDALFIAQRNVGLRDVWFELL